MSEPGVQINASTSAGIRGEVILVIISLLIILHYYTNVLVAFLDRADSRFRRPHKRRRTYNTGQRRETALYVDTVAGGMTADPDAIRNRLQVVHLDDALSLGDGASIYAEDPRTGCMGLGEVEAEAVGNAISVVVQYEEDGGSGGPYVKAPGRVVEKTWENDQSGVFESLRNLF